MHKLNGVEPAPITRDEVPEFVRDVLSAFHVEVPPHNLERWKRVLEPERTLALRDRGRIVAGAGIFSRRLTVPGGEVPVAAVTLVGVLPTHRRRGLLTTLMRRQLADVHEAGREAVAALWASEPVIYGRFGYGLGTQVARLEVAKREARLRTRPEARVELLAPADALPAMQPLFEELRSRAAGHARPRRPVVGGPHQGPRVRPRRRPAAARRRDRRRLRAVLGPPAVGERPPGRRGRRARAARHHRRGPRRDLELPDRARPDHTARLRDGTRRRPAAAHGRQRAGRAGRRLRRAVGAARRPPAGAARAQLRGSRSRSCSR